MLKCVAEAGLNYPYILPVCLCAGSGLGGNFPPIGTHVMSRSCAICHSSYLTPATDILLLESSNTYKEKNRDLLNKKQKEYCKKYPKMRKATTKKYRENHKEKIALSNKKYIKEHPKWYEEQKKISVERVRNRRSTEGYCKQCGKKLGHTFARLGLCKACAFRRDMQKYKVRTRRCYKNRSIEQIIKDSIRSFKYYYRYRWYINSRPGKILGMSNLYGKRLKDFNNEHEAIEKEIRRLGLRAPSGIWTSERIAKIFEKWKDYQPYSNIVFEEENLR